MRANGRSANFRLGRKISVGVKRRRLSRASARLPELQTRCAVTTFDSYLLRRFLQTFVILFVTFFGLYVVIDGFTNLDGFQETSSGTVSTLVVLRRMAVYYAYQSSMLIDLVGPTVAVSSVMVVAALLVKNSEYQPILAAGVPIVRICWPFILGIVVVTMAVIANQELIIPQIAHRLNGPRSEDATVFQNMRPQHDYSTGIVISGESLDIKKQRIMEPEFILPRELVTSLTTISARSARYVPQTSRNPAGWVLTDPLPDNYRILPLTELGRETVFPVAGSDELFIKSAIGFGLIVDGSRSASRQSTAELVQRIRNPAVSENLTRQQTLLLHQRIVQPLLNVLAGLACIPLVIRRESRSLVTSLALAAGIEGVMLGTVFLGGWLGNSGIFAADIAAWTPVVLCGAIGAWATGYAQT